MVRGKQARNFLKHHIYQIICSYLLYYLCFSVLASIWRLTSFTCNSFASSSSEIIGFGGGGGSSKITIICSHILKWQISNHSVLSLSYTLLSIVSRNANKYIRCVHSLYSVYMSTLHTGVRAQKTVITEKMPKENFLQLQT